MLLLVFYGGNVSQVVVAHRDKASKPVHRGIKVLLQQGSKRPKGKRSQRVVDKEQAPPLGDAK